MAFGFQSFPQQKGVDPRAVGMRLAQGSPPGAIDPVPSLFATGRSRQDFLRKGQLSRFIRRVDRERNDAQFQALGADRDLRALSERPDAHILDPDIQARIGQVNDSVSTTMSDRIRAREAADRERSEIIRRQAGAREMGTGRSNLHHSMGEALLRISGGLMPDPSPLRDRERMKMDVRRLGASEMEAELMELSGGL